MKPKTSPTRILVAEDSPVARELLVAILQNAAGMQVIGTARNGAEAVRLTHRLNPDVITMDIHMPEMDGIAATRQIMSETPRPVIMLSASLHKNKRVLTSNALQAGALLVIEKPKLNDPPEVVESLIRQIKLMAEVKVIRRWGDEAGKGKNARQQGGTPGQPALGKPVGMSRKGQTTPQLVVIAASTGGPGVLSKILSDLPANFPAPILVVQHITPGFGESLASWLDQQTALKVRLARQSDLPKAGEVLIAPDDYHMQLNRLGLVTLNQAPPKYGQRPSANILFQSAAEVYGATTLGVILTGMGNDGAEGLSLLRQNGAHTIAQDRESSIVFGMPAVAIELGAAEQILPADRIAPALLALTKVEG
jgi:two-component system chemotaxis response regulator CheB